MKFVPATASVNGADPATAVAGVNVAIAGPVNVNTSAGEEEVIVFFTVTFTAPAVASWAAVTAAVSEVALP